MATMILHIFNQVFLNGLISINRDEKPFSVAYLDCV